MTKFVSVQRDGFWWLALSYGDKLVYLYKQARVGDCFRPGQKLI